MSARSLALVVAAVAIAVIGVVISLAWNDSRQNDARSERIAEAVSAGVRIDTEVEDAVALAAAAEAIVETEDAEERTELARLARAAFSDPHIVAVAWAPRVGTDADPSYPVRLVESESTALSPGTDLTTLSGVPVALEAARASGETVLAAPEGGDALVLVREAVRRAPGGEAIPGAVAVVLEPDGLGAVADLESAVEVRAGATVLVDGEEAGSSNSAVLDVGGREWLVVFSSDSPSLVIPALVLALIVLAALVVVVVAVVGAARERRLRGEADREASRAEALRELAECISDTLAGVPAGIPDLSSAAARAVSDAYSAFVFKFSLDVLR